jgi:DNA-binding response OmpR family regulator
MQHAALELERTDVEPIRPAMDKVRSAQAAPKMLIADDDPAILRLLADHCARLGFDVDTACNGMQAILKARRTEPEIVVIDVNMPEVDGLTVCAHLLDRSPVNAIVITGSRNLDTLERCDGFGARYICKGPGFWDDLELALAEFHPRMAESIRHCSSVVTAPAVRKRPRVLLVDDDDNVNRFLASRLEKRGLEVRYASDAEQAYRMACKDEPAVIVTDCFMPHGDAKHLLLRLRTNAATANIPVIVLTGKTLHVATEQNLKREIRGNPGVADILRKSENTEPLFSSLQKFCSFQR